MVVKLGGDAGCPVGTVVFCPHCTDPRGQGGVCCLTGRPGRCTGPPVVETRPGHPDHVAQPLYAVALRVVGDELEAAHQRVSPAKYRAALRRMSRSSSNSRTLRRSAAFSSSTDPVGARPGDTATRPPPSRRCWSSARIQLRNVSGFTPRSWATDATVTPGRDRYNATASAWKS